jgi:hypothetical protein
MVRQQHGLTALYKNFHNAECRDPDVERIRQLHAEIDRAVARAYSWGDVELGHSLHETPQGIRFGICETAHQEVLDRLLAVNHERYAEEVRQGLHERGAKKRNERSAEDARTLGSSPKGTGGGKSKAHPGQPELGFEFQLTPPRAARR